MRIQLAFLLVTMLLLVACSGGYTGAAKQHWDADQVILGRAEKAKDARDFEASITAYEELWVKATQPNPPEGSLGDYFVLMGMSDLARKWTPAIEHIKTWEPPLAKLIKEGRASRSQTEAWTNLVDMTRLDERIIVMAEYLRANPEARKALDLDPYFRTKLMTRLRNQQHDELAVAFAPSPAAAILSGVTDTAGGVLGTVTSPIVAPLLGPLIAPR